MSWLPRRKAGWYFNVSLFWWANYYHWICDVLPRLYGISWDPDVRFILPREVAPWHLLTLEAMGLDSSRFVIPKDRRPWRVDRLLFIPPVIMTGNHEPHSIKGVRERLLAWAGTSKTRSSEKSRIYISRRRAKMRRIVNEEEIIPILKNHGFEVIETETLDFRDQIALFANTDIVVAPHGAGLTNLLWCAEPATCFEIFEPTSVRICYWSLARALGHRYFCAVGTSRPGQTENDLYVDPVAFGAALSHVVHHSK